MVTVMVMQADADVNNIENKLFVITGGGNFYNQLYAAFKVAVAVHNKNNYKALEINEKNAGW